MSEKMTNPIPTLLHIAGIRATDPEWGLQYNLLHASLAEFGVRAGLDHRVKSVLRARGLGQITEAGRARLVAGLRGILEGLQ